MLFIIAVLKECSKSHIIDLLLKSISILKLSKNNKNSFMTLSYNSYDLFDNITLEIGIHSFF